MPAAPSLSIVVFAYNEAENVGPTLRELTEYLRQHHPGSEIIFVDDGSSDGSLKVARGVLADQRAVLLRHEYNRGIGAALKTGVRAASADWVTFLPADGQIEPRAITTLLTAGGDDADVVFSTYGSRDDGLHRTLLSAGIRGLIMAVH